MAAAEIPQRPTPPAYMVKGVARMCPAVLGWRNGELLREMENSLGMERPIGGVLNISEITCVWINIVPVSTTLTNKVPGSTMHVIYIVPVSTVCANESRI